MSMEKLSELRSQVEAARQQMKVAAQTVVKEGANEVFKAYGDIVHSFGWAQYTPYFNDGDPCEFGVGELFIIAHEDLETMDEDEVYDMEREWLWDGGSPAFSHYSDDSKVGEYGSPEKRYVEAKQAIEAIYSALSSDDIAKDVFGDHVVVTFTPDGVNTEEYEHE